MKLHPISALSLALLLTTPLACSKKPVETPQPESPATVSQDAPAQEIPAEKVAQAPEAAPEIVPVNLDNIKDLATEDAENTILKSFNTASEPLAEKLKTLTERANIGDDEAKEEYIRLVSDRAYTDPTQKLALSFLSSIREFKDPEIMYKRAMLEYANIQLKADAKENAKKYLLMAADLNHEKSLEFLLKNSSLELNELALTKLNNIYKKRIESHDPKVLYDWAKMLEFAPMSYADQASQMLKESAEAGYAPARFTLAMSLIENNWNEGYDQLKKAAAAGSKDAWLFLANLYAMVVYTDNAEEAAQLGVMSFTPEQYKQVKAEIANAPKMAIATAAHNASGYDEACAILEAIGANSEQSEELTKVRNWAIECREQFVKEIPSRDACDRAYDQATYASAEEFAFETYYTEEQRKKIGALILNCYKNALSKGNDYPEEAPFVDTSTALQIALLYRGDSRIVIAPDPANEITYLTYAASQTDIFAMNLLAKKYLEGENVKQDVLRSCYWSQRSATSHICKSFCASKDNNESPICTACRISNDAVKDCREKYSK